MTPREFKTIRLALGQSAARMARLLGVTAGRTVFHWEAGERAIPGPVAKLMRLLDLNVIQPEDLEGLKD